ncbi:MAG: DEAD/DEAH box helicase [Candidatus Puniceispirillaceae bacterium]
MRFSDLGLSDELLQAINDLGYESPTPIQEQSIPYVLMGRDILGSAQTGTGKTASFTLPMIDILANGRAKARMPRSLILAPTRELAAQVAENFEKFATHHKLSMALLIGGVSFSDQEAALDKGVDVLIATPGRLLDHFERGKVLLQDVKILVIDEADRMLDMGFIPDVERIVNTLSKMRQTLFFSATLSDEIKKIGAKFVMNPKVISVAPPAATASTIEAKLIWTDTRKKRSVLRDLLREEDINNAVIFCNRKRDIATLLSSLQRHEFKVVALHGDMTQSARLAALEEFKSGESPLLIASDVAARGLDIPSVSHVFNFDVPSNAEDYVHRIGRTGRAGRTGKAYTLGVPNADDKKLVSAVEQLIGSPIEVLETHSASDDSKQTGKKAQGQKKAKEADHASSAAVKKTHNKANKDRNEHGELRPVAWTGGNSFKESDDIPAFLRSA